MILILLYWLFLFSIFLPCGIIINNFFKLKTSNIWLLVLLGMFFFTTGFSIVALFSPLGFETLLLFSSISFFAFYKNKAQIASVVKTNFSDLQLLPLAIKYIVCILIAGALFKSSQLPTIIDNESYYIQTIKWLNEYGYVKGLANLHLFFAQTSSWHVLQAGLNFSFIYSTINDINGFVFIVCTLFCITQTQKHFLHYKQLHWLGFMPVFLAIFLLFIDSPSPDLPVILITPIVLYLLTINNNKTEKFRTAFLLFIFIAFIKITIAPLAVIFIYFFNDKNKIVFTAKIVIPIALVWLCKNIILSGYPLYPFTTISFDLDWTVPERIFKGMHAISNKYVYSTVDNSITVKILSWIMQEGLKGYINKLVILLFFIILLFKKIRTNKIYLIIYIAFAIHFVALLFISPQYRFFLPELLFFSAFICSQIYNNFIFRITVYNFCIIAGVFAGGITLLYNPLKTSLAGEENDSGAFKFSYLYQPATVSSSNNTLFIKNVYVNLTYYSPYNNSFLYATGNGPLPCVNKRQVQYMRKKFKVIPQMRTGDIKDGFYSLEISDAK